MSTTTDLKQQHQDDDDDDEFDDEYDEDEDEILSDLSDLFEEDSHLLQLNVDTRELALDDVPFDRDLKYINVAGGSGQVDEKAMRRVRRLVLTEGDESKTRTRRRDRGGTRARRSRRDRSGRTELNGTSVVNAIVSGGDVTKDRRRTHGRGNGGGGGPEEEVSITRSHQSGSMSPERRGGDRRRIEGDSYGIRRGDGRNRNPTDTDIVDGTEDDEFGEGSERRRRARGTRGRLRGRIGDRSEGAGVRREKQQQLQEQEQKLWKPMKLMTRPETTAIATNAVMTSATAALSVPSSINLETAGLVDGAVSSGGGIISSSLKAVVRQKLNERPHSVQPVHKLSQPRSYQHVDKIDFNSSVPSSTAAPFHSGKNKIEDSTVDNRSSLQSSSLLPPSPPSTYYPNQSMQQQRQLQSAGYSVGGSNRKAGGGSGGEGKSGRDHHAYTNGSTSIHTSRGANVHEIQQQQQLKAYSSERVPPSQQHYQQMMPSPYKGQQKFIPQQHQQQFVQQVHLSHFTHSNQQYRESQATEFQQRQSMYNQTPAAANYSNGSSHPYYPHQQSVDGGYGVYSESSQSSAPRQPDVASKNIAAVATALTNSSINSDSTYNMSSMDYTDPNQQLRVTAPEFTPSFLRAGKASGTGNNSVAGITSSLTSLAIQAPPFIPSSPPLLVNSNSNHSSQVLLLPPQPNPLAPEFKPSFATAPNAGGSAYTNKNSSSCVDNDGGYII